jgi:hypothetical protein
MRRVFVLMASTALAGCATFKPPQISYDDDRPAVLQGESAVPRAYAVPFCA